MTHFDVFNGDADGICALTQLRNLTPVEATLITGVKRDIALLDRVDAKPGDHITVLDISLDKNRAGLETALQRGAQVFYVDHHFAGDIPTNPALTTIINTTPDVCTSLLINQHLQGAFQEWAVVGTFGDNLRKSALALCKPLDLNEAEIAQLENLGIYINYNGYGDSIDDLYFPPAELFRHTSAFATPQEFMAEDKTCFDTLENGYRQDMAKAQQCQPVFCKDHAAIYILPDARWARRVSGVFGNELANQNPQRAHAVLTERSGKGYLVSVRAPLQNKTGADEICRQFPTGGGRKAAAGINDLPSDQLDRFIDALSSYYQ